MNGVDEYLCGTCKTCFNDIYKFLEHKRQISCSQLNTNTDLDLDHQSQSLHLPKIVTIQKNSQQQYSIVNNQNDSEQQQQQELPLPELQVQHQIIQRIDQLHDHQEQQSEHNPVHLHQNILLNQHEQQQPHSIVELNIDHDNNNNNSSNISLLNNTITSIEIDTGNTSWTTSEPIIFYGSIENVLNHINVITPASSTPPTIPKTSINNVFVTSNILSTTEATTPLLPPKPPSSPLLLSSISSDGTSNAPLALSPKIESNNTQLRIVECKICGQRYFHNKAKLHLNTHKVWPNAQQYFDELELIYRCMHCPVKSPNFVGFTAHMKTHKTEQIYACPMSNCQQTFPNEMILIEHSISCAYHSTIRCTICFKFFYTYDELHSHTIEHNENDKILKKSLQKPMGKRKPKLPLSGEQQYITNKYSNMHTNLRTIKLINKSSTNHIDGAITVDDAKPSVSIMDVAEVQKSTPTIPTDKTTDTSNNNNNNNQSLNCYICNLKFINHPLLLKHLEKETHNHPCAQCNKTFLNRHKLTRHLLTHSNQLRKCPYCDKTYTVEAYLRNHMMTHGDVKFICDFCGKVCSRKDSLIRHLNLHLAPLYKCSHRGCKRSYRKKELLREHINKHQVHGIRIIYGSVYRKPSKKQQEKYEYIKQREKL